jgi:hypothetical protein
MATVTSSPKGNLFVKVLERLKAKVPELRFIDQDMGQLENYAEGFRPPVAWPCALLDADDFNYSDTTANLQEGDGFVQIRIGVLQWSPTNNLANDSVRLAGLEFWNLEQKVHEALHGWKDEGFSSLLRRSARLEKRNDNIRVLVCRYSVSISDQTTKKATTIRARPNAEISGQLKEV